MKGQIKKGNEFGGMVLYKRYKKAIAAYYDMNNKLYLFASGHIIRCKNEAEADQLGKAYHK